MPPPPPLSFDNRSLRSRARSTPNVVAKVDDRLKRSSSKPSLDTPRVRSTANVVAKVDDRLKRSSSKPSLDTPRVRSTPNFVATIEDRLIRSIFPSHLGREPPPQTPPEESREDKDSGLLDLDLAVESFNRYSEYAGPGRESLDLNDRQSYADRIALLAFKEATIEESPTLGKQSARKPRLPNKSSCRENVSLSLSPNAKNAKKKKKTRNKSRPAPSRRPAAEKVSPKPLPVAEKVSPKPLPVKQIVVRHPPSPPKESRGDKDSDLLESDLLNFDSVEPCFSSCFGENIPQADGKWI